MIGGPFVMNVLLYSTGFNQLVAAYFDQFRRADVLQLLCQCRFFQQCKYGLLLLVELMNVICLNKWPVID